MVCLAGCIVLGAVGTGTASAADDRALLRVAHLSPDTPAVDVALAPLPDGSDGVAEPGPDIATGLGYGNVGDYRHLAPGSYALSIRAADSDSRTPPSLSVRVEIPPGGARTVAVSGPFADLSLTVLTDDLSDPGTGSARVRVLAAAASAATVDVDRVGGPALADAVPFGKAGSYTTVPAGPATARVAGERTDLLLDLPAGSISSLLVLDRPDGGLTLRVVLDAAGPAAVPVGPVPAGAGGAAGLPWPLPGIALAGAAAVGLVAAGRRRLALSLVAALSGLTAPAAAAPPVPAGVQTGVQVAARETPSTAAARRLQVPSAGIDTAPTAVGLDTGGALIPPADPATAGWFAQGPVPGEPGPAVLAGHVDSSAGPAVFFRLGDVAVGDPVLVTRADGSTVRFTVTRIGHYPKAAFPTREVYGPTPDAQLRLITCGGEFDHAAGSYLDNVVVYAELT